MIIAIDAGNTRIKCAVFENTSMIDLSVFEYGNFEKKITSFFQKHSSISKIILSNVGKQINFDFLKTQYEIEIVTIDGDFKFPFQNKYQTPHTLGIDRMILSSGATLQFPNQNRLIIDVGTCITYDFVDAHNNYLGGAISPGIGLRYKSMHQYTEKLPLLTPEEPESFIGNSTTNAMHSGVIYGISHEIDGFINSYRTEYPNFIIILTGGDTVFLAKRLKNTIFANPNFLLESLIYTYQYKIEND